MNKNPIYSWLAIFMLLVSASQIQGDDPMPRGRPDGNLQPYSNASIVNDPGVIYMMLWGFSPIDSQGRPYYLDTFNNGLGGFAYTVTGAAQPPTIISGSLGTQVYSPPNAAKFSPGVVAGNRSALVREYYLGTNYRLGLEAGFNWAFESPQWIFTLVYKPVNKQAYIPQLSHQKSINQWRIAIDPPGTYQNIFPMSVVPSGSTLNIQIKLVGDWSTGKYVRALIGDNLIDLSAYSMPIATAYDGYISAEFRATSYGAGTSSGLLGYVLLTKDEP